ncbi:FAD-dependent oxidoreductase [Dyadobacter sp. CY323]|uniref:FAD-dependent oxidoreductase n=1 Tax=Dyadobacter sp. CY323 TaxID=2907302 RepID=UPI001F3FD964|nr:FAD-dependent oxidoreductase [Dyadobacter sp. CY323]MCE6989576.1 FAD-dependent oxidoreductase [Dyadobacter sp. CY323]
MKRISIRTLAIVYLILISSGFGFAGKARKSFIADVVIYGSTSPAIMSAVQLARMKKHVIIVCPEMHIGGMSSSGLSFTDVGNKNVVGGLSREFYQRIYSHYQNSKSWNWQRKDEFGNVGQGTKAMDSEIKAMWVFEPHVAEKVFEDYIKENKIKIVRNKWLDRKDGVEMKDGKIVSITMLTGEHFKGKIFIDATYEGDLMAAAGVSYTVGRESNSMYNEKWNGNQPNIFHHGHNFGTLNISPYRIPNNAASGLLPRISSATPGKKGEGDHRIQAYCFRTCLTDVKENRVPFKRPENYDSTQYELLARLVEKGWSTPLGAGNLPNRKKDANNKGAFSHDNIGMNYDYPEASYEERKRILKEHETYQKGLFYFYATDTRVPVKVREIFNTWGLSKNEFVDNGNWPYQIYVREARRMIGESVITENEVQGEAPVLQPIGMGAYAIDSHNTHRYVTPEGFVQNEGDIGVGVKKPYQISLGVILPKRQQCSNLIVSAALSSSHSAFGSVRMEPVFMILGQSAGTLAGMALDRKMGLHEVPYSDLRKRLQDDKQILE